MGRSRNCWEIKYVLNNGDEFARRRRTEKYGLMPRLEWAHRLVRSNGTLGEEEDRQDNCVNYRSIFNRRSGYKYNDLLKLRLASLAPQPESDAREAAGFSAEIFLACDAFVSTRF